MTSNVLMLTTWAAMFISVSGNYYFATHESYKTSVYNTLGSFTLKFSGSVSSVTQQCRRSCVFETNSGAYRINLESGSEDLGQFTCRVFISNACFWKGVGLRNTLAKSYFQVWEKLDARDFKKPKSCLEYCQVQYKGNCTACRGYDNLSGTDCDIAPKLCSDYNFTGSKWENGIPLWPWGFYRKTVKASCNGNGTRFLLSADNRNGSRTIFSLGHSSERLSSDSGSYMAEVKAIDWETISEAVTMSKNKTLAIAMNSGSWTGWAYYSGLYISPTGALSLNGSLHNTTSTGIPVPLVESPFVIDPNCGAFWQFNASVSICNQRSYLFSFNSIRWDGRPNSGYIHVSLLLY